MVLVKVLERRDASSLIVAIAAGLAVGSFVMGLANSLVGWILDNGPSMDFVDDILQPVFVLILVFLLLEGLARLTIAARGEMSKR